jgi:hypothetical protein
MELSLHVCFGAILATATGCGECPKDVPAPQQFTVTFTTNCVPDADVEASVDASDASTDDASTDAQASTDGEAGVASDSGSDASDASDASFANDGGGDAGLACFATCDQACAQLEPTELSSSGFGVCVSSVPGRDGVVTASCETRIMCGGRKLDGLSAPTIDASDERGAWVARMAWLEAASVHAFRRLASELEAHGAPRELVMRAKASARDEVRHARMMKRIAKKHGIAVPRVRVAKLANRDLVSIAIENAVEGCVGETYGALYAAWQAMHERDADVAHAMSAIAPDELRHAALGWAVAEWIDGKLTPFERARVRTARDAAAREILAGTSSHDERVLAEGLMTRLWAA